MGLRAILPARAGGQIWRRLRSRADAHSERFLHLKSVVSRLGCLIAIPVAALTFCAAGPSRAEESAAAPDKLVFLFQKQKDPREVEDHARRVAELLTDRIGVPVDVVVPASYGASVQALVSGRAHVAYVSALPYLLAKEEAPVRLILAEVRGGTTSYSSIFVVKADAKIESLAGLKGAHMLFTSPTSTSGYVMPYSRLVGDGLLEPKQDPAAFFGKTSFAGGYDRALRGVLNGQADVCAVSDYTMEGPKADVYLTAEERAGLRILDRTPGVPTHGICVRADLPEPLQEKIRDALLDLSRSEADLLADVYGAAEFQAVDGDEHVQSAITALERTGLGLKGLVE